MASLRLTPATEVASFSAIRPRDRGLVGEPDCVVFARAIAEDPIIATENADDFHKLAAAVDLHPGLIILQSVARL